MRTTNTETFTSFLRLPQNFLSPPVLENVGGESIDPTQCLITRTNVDGIFALDLSQVSSACPVKGGQTRVLNTRGAPITRCPLMSSPLNLMIHCCLIKGRLNVG